MPVQPVWDRIFLWFYRHIVFLVSTQVLHGYVHCLAIFQWIILKNSYQVRVKAGPKNVLDLCQAWVVWSGSQTKAGQFLNLAALPFLPQSVVSVLGGLAIVFNAAFAHAMLGEHLRKREVMLMMAMTLGFKSGSG